MSVGELVDGALDSGADCVAGLPVGGLLLGADAQSQVTEFSWGKAHGLGAVGGGGAPGADRAGTALALGEPGHDQRGGGGRGRRVGAVPALADLALGAGDLSAVEVDVEVVPAEALVLTVLAGGVARQWAADGDLVLALGSFQVDQGDVATVDQVLGWQQSTTRRSGVDAGQSLAVVCGGRGGAQSIITLTLSEAHVSVTCAANPFQLMMCPWRT